MLITLNFEATIFKPSVKSMRRSTIIYIPFSVAPAPSCNGVINRARGGTALASSELVSTHAAAMAFDGEKQKTFRT